MIVIFPKGRNLSGHDRLETAHESVSFNVVCSCNKCLFIVIMPWNFKMYFMLITFYAFIMSDTVT